MATAEDKATQAHHRSPNYPFVDLPAAIEKVRVLYRAVGRHAVGTDVLIQKMGYTPKSSSGKKVLGALRAFGLVDDTRVGRDQLLKLSDRALDIVADYREGDAEWNAAIRAAARSPKIHAAVLGRYSGSLPPDDELRRYLVRVYDPPFTDAGAGDFIAEIRSTLAYAERTGPEVDTSENGIDPEPSQREVRVGSFVQWTSQGVDRFPKPLPVVGVDGDWAFLEGSPTGVPMSELAVVDVPNPETNLNPPTNPFYRPIGDEEPKAGAALERMTLDEGPVKLEWPSELSPESVAEFEYWLAGLVKRAKRKAGIDPQKKTGDK
ncbi:MAG TPA: hypothetical protein VL175_10695 [Pirellulales bacterium]|jgi:hypothetical protein|nr:hypothetical protein [Pirellulales bacterium]